jgi:thiol-disulfide isomerase/thioredoxin
MQLEEFKSLLFVHYLWKMLSIMYTYKDKVDPYSIPLDSLMFQVFGNVDSDFTNVQITDYVKYYFLSLYIPYSKAGSLDKSVSYFRETCKNKEYLDYVNSLKPLETLNKYEGKDSVEKSDLTGKKAPDFTCDDLKGNKYSLNDFKGKYVFIDFWATWCGPCKQEIPHMKKLVKDYKFYDEIIFVSISLDGDQIKWKEFVKDNNMTWLQLWAKPDSKYFEEYQVEYIPKFVIIDKERKILNANAPRPSDKELKEVLDKILEN